jgi:hypothetical protein
MYISLSLCEFRYFVVEERQCPFLKPTVATTNSEAQKITPQYIPPHNRPKEEELH